MFADTRKGYRSGNYGLWVLTAMSSMVRKEKESSGNSLVYGQLKSVTLDICTPHLQKLTPEGDAIVFDYEEYVKPWHDSYPLELYNFQVHHELGVGGDVSCLVEGCMPSLNTIRIRCRDIGVPARGALSSVVGQQLLRDICKHRRKGGNTTKKCKKLMFYSGYADQSMANGTTSLAKDLQATFEEIGVKPTHHFPFF